MRIQNNIMAMNAYRNYTNNTSALSKNLEKLSSGYKINRAGDDAAGLAISEKMRAQITGLDVAQKNANDGISLVQTAEGALTEVHDMLNRMYELAEQSANGTYDGTDRAQLQKEVTALSEEINRIAQTTNFNGIDLFTGEGGDTTVANVEATLDQTNAAKLGEATGFTFAADATDEQKAAFVEALGESGAAIKVGINAAADTGLTDADTVKLTSLPDGYTFKFTDATDATATVTDGTAITVGSATGNLDDADISDAVTFDVYDADDNKIGTFTVDVSSLTGITTSNEQTTTVTLAAAAEEAAAAEPTVTAATVEKSGAGKDNLGDVSLAFADDATDEQRTALNEALAGASITVTTKDVDGNTTVDANDTIQVDGLMAGYTYKFVAADGNTEVAYTDGTELTYAAGGTDGAAALDAGDDLALNIYDADGNKVATLTIGAPTALATSTTEETTLTFTAPEGEGGGDGAEETVNLPEGEIWLQIGEDANAQNRIQVNIGKVDTTALNIADIDISSQNGALNALSKIENAINQVSGIRGDLGAVQNRLEHTINNLGVMQENIQNAESTIRDTDVAEEMMAYTKNNILIQSAQAMLAQANQVPQGVLQLLQ